MKSHAEAFRKKYRAVTVKAGRLWAAIKRPYTTPEALLKDSLRDEYVRSRTRGARPL
jgi:hypothetical protein